jgi:hypothetical protein
MTSGLSPYQQLATLHDEMAKAAFALAWDKLQALEQQSAKLISTLQESVQLPLGADVRRDIEKHIQHILAQQNIIRDEVAQWQADVKPLLSILSRNTP